ncbi:MAG TPA: hypothetical protein ENJ53_06000 [Phaeodactylibacter sp.]|nr:hypothetical protein [Phaeodactylibacter sp.]
MKDLILDEIIIDDFHRLLKKGERIIWEGQPQKLDLINPTRNDSRLNVWLRRMGEILAVWFFVWALSAWTELFIGYFGFFFPSSSLKSLAEPQGSPAFFASKKKKITSK